MKRDFFRLTLNQRREYQLAAIFLEERLQLRTTVEWAVEGDHSEAVQQALRDVVDRGVYRKSLAAPWAEVWRLILESWDRPNIDYQRDGYELQLRVQRGERSEHLIGAITDLLRPRLAINLSGGRRVRSPRNIHQLVSAHLESGDVIAPSELKLDTEDNLSFLQALARTLDGVLAGAVHTERQIRPDGEVSDWRLGQLYRVYFVPSTESGRETTDAVDEHHKGIAPTVKLLHATVARIAALNAALAAPIVEGWKQATSPPYVRLWAALARDRKVEPASAVAAKLLEADDEEFWDIHAFPEIAEVRSVRFDDLDQGAREQLINRLRRGPPLSRYFRRVARQKAVEAARYWSLRELRRIELAGGHLPNKDAEWLHSQIEDHPALNEATRIDFDFSDSTFRWGSRESKVADFGDLTGAALLGALESAFATPRVNWDEDASEAAGGWIGVQSNAARVVSALTEENINPSAFPLIWERLGWSHKPQDNPSAAHEAAALMPLVAQLSDETLRQAIDGIAYWLSNWSEHEGPNVLAAWMRVWPFAVEATNRQRLDGDQPNEDVSPIQQDIDALNNPVSRMINVFFDVLGKRDPDIPAFQQGTTARAMRDCIDEAPGHAGIVANYLLLQNISYFLRLDQPWADRRLLVPLREENAASRPLWYAVTYRTQFFEVISRIGDAMLWRATDPQLARKARESLVFSLVVECLNALREEREPAVEFFRVQQMLRSVEDEVRGHGAWAVLRFIQDVSSGERDAPTAENLFDVAVRPFLGRVWPQEKNLVTPTVANHFAELPAAAGERFSEAVQSVERFLAPFECWSMLEFGLWGNDEGESKLLRIDTEERAAAFLKLLDLTVGRAEGAVVPLDLSEALRRIAEMAPALATSHEYRRLKAQARERT